MQLNGRDIMDRDDEILDYLQNRLAPADRAQFEKAMANDRSLAAEVGLMRSVRAELKARPVHEDADAVWDRLSAAIDPAPQTANDNRRPWLQVLRYAAVAVVAVAAWQLAIVPRISVDPDGFQVASERSVGFVLQVKFVDSAAIGEIAELLRPLNGTITDGPTALGLVRVSFADEKMQQEALDLLASRSDLVEFALED
ncbi:MAG: hypothetical protein Kilf2KO_11670 [Rhodospirillales bacterium]